MRLSTTAVPELDTNLLRERVRQGAAHHRRGVGRRLPSWAGRCASDRGTAGAASAAASVVAGAGSSTFFLLKNGILGMLCSVSLNNAPGSERTLRWVDDDKKEGARRKWEAEEKQRGNQSRAQDKNFLKRMFILLSPGIHS